MYGRLHLYAGPTIVLGGIINGFNGFNFSGEPQKNVYYGAVVAVVIIVVLASLVWKRWSKNKQAKHNRIMDGDELNDDAFRMSVAQGPKEIQ
jgi:undecaprenyl pyrophosphate phosphatase UppP